MSFKRFSTYFKAAQMLRAREGLEQIQYSTFKSYKKETKEKIIRALKAAATMFEEKKLKDYREVLKNITEGLNRAGR